MHHSLLEKVQSLLSTAGLDKSVWVEALIYCSHLMNWLPLTAIRGKTLLEIWSGGAARDHGSLRVFGCPATVDSSANKLVFFGYKKDLKGYRLWDPKNKKLSSSRHITLHEASVVKPTISR